MASFKYLTCIVTLVLLFVMMSSAQKKVICQGVEMKFPFDVDAAEASCFTNQDSNTCKVVCVMKYLDLIDQKDKIKIPKIMDMIKSFPKDVRKQMLPKGLKCQKHMKANTLKNLDSTCSELEPALRCISNLVREHCNVGDYALFLQD